MPKNRITLLAACAGLLVVLMGILPSARSAGNQAAGNTAAFEAINQFSITATELLPLGLLVIAAAAILYGTGIL